MHVLFLKFMYVFVAAFVAIDTVSMQVGLLRALTGLDTRGRCAGLR